MKNKKRQGRRKFIKGTVTMAVGTGLVGPSIFGAPAIIRNYGKPDSKINGVQIGVITYSFRSMEDQSAEATLKYILDAGISAIELMGDPAEAFAGKPESTIDNRLFSELRRKNRDAAITEGEKRQFADLEKQRTAYDEQVSQWRKTVSMKKFVAFRKMYNDAGVDIYAFKPRNTFGKSNSDADIEWGMKTAKVLGASHVTVEHPNDDAQTRRLGSLAKKNGIYMAYHGHTQQTPTFWDTALRQSNFNALNLDLGHYVAAGNPDPLNMLMDKHDRIKSMHLKDRQTPENNQGNLPWGNGDTPISKALRLMRDEKYDFPGTIELEYNIPEGSNAVEEVKKCLAYCEEALK